MSIKQKSAYFLVAIIILQIIFLTIIAAQKEGYFIDEIYTYGLSNGYYKPFLRSYDNMFDNWIGRDLFYDYITVQQGEEFAFDSVYYNQTQDVHPPIHYFLIHAVSSFFPNVFSAWIGFSINFIIFILCQIFIYRISKILFADDKIALLPVILFGFTPAGINQALYIRMYMLMTLFTVLFLYLHIKVIKKNKIPIPILIAISLTCIAGFLTHYYFIFFAFFTALFFLLYKIIREKKEKKFWGSVSYAAVMLGSMGFAILVYPVCINQIFTNNNFVANKTVENLTSLSGFFSSVKTSAKAIALEIFIRQKIVIVLFIAITALAIYATVYLFIKLNKAYKSEGKINLKMLIKSNFGEKDAISLAILFITFLSFLLVSKLAVVFTTRYFYNLYPFIIILIVCFCFQFNRLLLKNKKIVYILLAASTVPASLIILLTKSTLFMYPGESEYIRNLENYSENYCLYINDGKNPPITADLFYLTIYKGVYITEADNIKKFDEIFKGKDIDKGIIVYVDTNERWSSGYDAVNVLNEIKQVSGFDNVLPLEETHLAYTYYVY